MRYLINILAMVLLMSSCDAQQSSDQQKNQPDTSVIEPQTEIKVNKEYDDQGNLIRYDSVYSRYYSNIEGDTVLRDSVFKRFKRHMHSDYPFSTEPFFNEMFFNDSLLFYDFYKEDFFQNRFERNLWYMEQYFREMDSLKNRYFREQMQGPPKGSKNIEN